MVEEEDLISSPSKELKIYLDSSSEEMIHSVCLMTMTRMISSVDTSVGDLEPLANNPEDSKIRRIKVRIEASKEWIHLVVLVDSEALAALEATCLNKMTSLEVVDLVKCKLSNQTLGEAAASAKNSLHLAQALSVEVQVPPL